ncbi:MAG: TlpA disulfide reductase family protein [Halopseudomonas sp.]|uniref:TlpA family protein disulfide reductase n=1 Tax=Halopseudomonas sp. TaxID=2901191 RepID=UPI00300221E4
MFFCRSVLLFAFCLLLGACGPAGWPDQHGNQVLAQDLEGKRVVVNYWAQWCGPCRDELPELNRLARDFPQARVIGIDFDGATGEELLAATEQMNIEFAVLGADFAAAKGLAKPEVLPTTYILDEQGEVLHTLRGPQHYQDLAPFLSTTH